MYGFQAISAAGGWAITVAGLAIVFSGLVILATLIAHVEKLLLLWDRRGELWGSKQAPPRPPGAPAESAEPQPAIHGATVRPAVIHLTEKERETAEHFRLITRRLGEPFSLMRLLEQAEKRGIATPYSHLDTFLKMELIVECNGEFLGFYQWRKDVRIHAEEDEETYSA